MSGAERENEFESMIPIKKRKSQMITLIMLVIGLFAPFSLEIYNYGSMSHIVFSSMLWMFRQSSYMNGYFGFSFPSLYSLSPMFLFLLLRMVPVSQIYRYYDGKTTRQRVLIAIIIGDGFFLVTGIFSLFFTIGYSGVFMMPLPFQIIFGFIVLWKYPIPEPTTPWENISESKSRLDKKPDSITEKLPNDNDKLW